MLVTSSQTNKQKDLTAVAKGIALWLRFNMYHFPVELDVEIR